MSLSNISRRSQFWCFLFFLFFISSTLFLEPQLFGALHKLKIPQKCCVSRNISWKIYCSCFRQTAGDTFSEPNLSPLHFISTGPKPSGKSTHWWRVLFECCCGTNVHLLLSSAHLLPHDITLQCRDYSLKTPSLLGLKNLDYLRKTRVYITVFGEARVRWVCRRSG